MTTHRVFAAANRILGTIAGLNDSEALQAQVAALVVRINLLPPEQRRAAQISFEAGLAAGVQAGPLPTVVNAVGHG